MSRKAYGREQPWAWWVPWILPSWAAAVFVVTTAILVIRAPRMVRRR